VAGDLVLIVHSGSRGPGERILRAHAHRQARSTWGRKFVR
jgi:RNA-splicing ligase RtcB